jgi:tripartite-type tricarboxylate transporter receptor subunit TctC
MWKSGKLGAAAVAALCLFAAHPAAAADPFYKGKTVSIVIPAGPGGGYGNVAQMLGPHFSRNIPGKPNVITDFQPGAGGLKAANYLYNVSRRDGTVVALLFKDTPMFQILRRSGVKFDMRKMSYIGSMGPIVNTVALWHGAPAKTVEDCMKMQVVMGATGRGPTMYMIPQLMNKLMGTKFKIVTGYKGAAPVRMAMENGEAHGMVVTWDSWKTGAPGWVRDKKINTIAQLAPKKAADLPDVPLLTDFVKDPEAKTVFSIIARTAEVGWYMSTPPEVPKERLATLRAAFEATMKDPAFLADAKSRGLDVDPISAQTVEAAVHAIVNTPKPLVTKIQTLLEY